MIHAHPKHKRTITVTVSYDEYVTVLQTAAKRGITIATLMRQAIKKEIK